MAGRTASIPRAERPEQRARRVAASTGRRAGTEDASGQHASGPVVLQHAVTATFWLDPGDEGEPAEAAVRFTGRRVGSAAGRHSDDRFERVEVARVVPGSGPVAVTAKVPGLAPGEWSVRAQLVQRRGDRSVTPLEGAPVERARGLRALLWRRGGWVGAAPATVRTRVVALAGGPGILPGSWFGFVLLGFLVAVAVLAVLLSRVGASPAVGAAVAFGASVAGVVGARVWYLVQRRGTPRGLPTQGLCIQGFITGVVVVAVPSLLLAGIPPLLYLDAVAPGLFVAMALGRQGCFFIGCCTGRVTGSRWGLWSSDGRIGARRVPAQQLEAALALALSVASLAAFLAFGTAADGAVFLVGLALYTLGRQVLLGVRSQPRTTRYGRTATMVGAVVVAVLAVAWGLWR